MFIFVFNKYIICINDINAVFIISKILSFIVSLREAAKKCFFLWQCQKEEEGGVYGADCKGFVIVMFEEEKNSTAILKLRGGR